MQKRIPFSLAKKRLKRKYWLRDLDKKIGIPLAIFALGVSVAKYWNKLEMAKIEKNEVEFREKLQRDMDAHDQLMKIYMDDAFRFKQEHSTKVPRFYYDNYEMYKSALPSKIEWVNPPSTNPSSKDVSSPFPTNKLDKSSPYYGFKPQIYIGKKAINPKLMFSRTARSSISRRRS